MDETQKDFFSSKQKSQTEIVITRFNESLDWIQGVEHICTIYNKGEPFTSKATCIDVSNNGLGLETLLRHIIIRYHSLAEITMFCQGNIDDRSDQVMYAFDWYFTNMDSKGIKGRTSLQCDLPTFRNKEKCENEACWAIGGRNLGQFRKEVVGIPYNMGNEYWVRGDWISLSKACILKKPRAYYSHLYSSCDWKRGIFLEECWYLERSLYTIFTKPFDNKMRFPADDSITVTNITPSVVS